MDRRREPRMAPELSSDILLFHILPRLPAKSLRRFLCVSKQCQSFLSTPEFAKMQLHHVTTNQHQDEDNHQKFLVLSKEPYNFRIIDCNPKENSLTSSCRRNLPFKGRDICYKLIVKSFHGLLCIGILKDYFDRTYSDLILWNPVTGDYKRLSKPATTSHQECYDIYGGTLTGLYYSSSDEDYKLLRVTCHPHAYIYSLKSDSWRKIQSTETFRHIYSSNSPLSGLFFNEKLYFLETLSFGGNYSVIRFDTKTEKFTQIATPSPFSRNITTENRLSIMLLRGCIHLFATIFLPGDKRCDELLRMDEDDQHGDNYWTKVDTISEFSLGQKPFHLMRNGNWLVRSGYDGGNVYQVSKKKPYTYTRWLCSLGRSDILIEERYMETLVSPNQYMIK